MPLGFPPLRIALAASTLRWRPDPPCRGRGADAWVASFALPSPETVIRPYEIRNAGSALQIPHGEDLVFAHARRRLDLGGVAGVLADQRPRDRRADRDFF